MSQSCQLVQIATCCHEQTSRARPLHVFCLVSSPSYCMMEPSVAMVTGVANSNSTVEIGLLVALGCCWSRVGMKKGINPPFWFFLVCFSWRAWFLHRVCSWWVTAQKLTGNILIIYSHRRPPQVPSRPSHWWRTLSLTWLLRISL